MENKLKKMFDYQRFEKNARIENMINAAESRYAVRELSDEELFMVSAAGFVKPEQKEDSK